jgi:hypothetical protein
VFLRGFEFTSFVKDNRQVTAFDARTGTGRDDIRISFRSISVAMMCGAHRTRRDSCGSLRSVAAEKKDDAAQPDGHHAGNTFSSNFSYVSDPHRQRNNSAKGAIVHHKKIFPRTTRKARKAALES